MKISFNNLVYRDAPSFGIDIGHSSIKIMQIEKNKGEYRMNAYGNTQLDPSFIEKGVIKNVDLVARNAYDLITTKLKGRITMGRVGFSIPNEYSFSRVMTVPNMSSRELGVAIENELQQSMPLSLDELYFDYDVVNLQEQQEIQIVAAPRKIVDSYVAVGENLGLETAFIETNIGGVARAVTNSEITKGLASLIIDLGSSAADLTLYDGNQIRITSTADCGGESLTKAIANELDVNAVQAHIVKTRYGLDPSKKQNQIVKAVGSVFDKLFTEIKKVNRYYAEHSDGKAIEQIIIVGGGSNIPGISHYMTNALKIPTRVCNPWININFGTIEKPDPIESTLYTTAIGLALGYEKDFIK